MKTRPQLRAIHQGFTVIMQRQTTVPDSITRKYKTEFTHPAHPPIGHIVSDLETTRRQPGILDKLLAAKSHDEACEIWASFQNQNPKPSQKTINRAMRILTAQMEGRIG